LPFACIIILPTCAVVKKKINFFSSPCPMNGSVGKERDRERFFVMAGITS
jgi:hypothetical protein